GRVPVTPQHALPAHETTPQMYPETTVASVSYTTDAWFTLNDSHQAVDNTPVFEALEGDNTSRYASAKTPRQLPGCRPALAHTDQNGPRHTKSFPTRYCRHSRRQTSLSWTAISSPPIRYSKDVGSLIIINAHGITYSKNTMHRCCIQLLAPAIQLAFHIVQPRPFVRCGTGLAQYLFQPGRRLSPAPRYER